MPRINDIPAPIVQVSCEYCGATCASMADANQHETWHHKLADLISCSACGAAPGSPCIDNNGMDTYTHDARVMLR